MMYPLHSLLLYLAAHIHWPLPLVAWPVPYALPFWCVYIWTRGGERKVLLRKSAVAGLSDDSSMPAEDKGSWALIDYGSKAAKLAALIAAFATPAWGTGAARLALYGTGIALMIAGTLLRRHCFRLLGRYFTFRVSVPETHAIVQDGIYKWVRHPSYTGGMLYNVGIGFALTNRLSVIFLALGMMIVYVYRVRVEEKALIQVHGAAYRDYMRMTKRFIPFLL